MKQMLNTSDFISKYLYINSLRPRKCFSSTDPSFLVGFQSDRYHSILEFETSLMIQDWWRFVKLRKIPFKPP